MLVSAYSECSTITYSCCDVLSNAQKYNSPASRFCALDISMHETPLAIIDCDSLLYGDDSTFDSTHEYDVRTLCLG